uniref:CLIP domain-containing serine protease n=1 Tax=Clastoptera arizonana TaxID=38151 RepID=A0A1B6D8K3_9HEMI
MSKSHLILWNNCSTLLLFTIISLVASSGNRVKRQVIYNTTTNVCTSPDSRSGTCINIKNCPELLDLLLYQRSNVTAIRFILASTCYYQGRTPVVCCPGEFDEINLVNDLSVCGLSSFNRERVVGGRAAVAGSWPWAAALGYTNNGVLEWLCGGTLVSDRYIVTAAHCIVNERGRALTKIRIGDVDMNTEKQDGAFPVDAEIDEIIPHENYNASNRVADIGLVRIRGRISQFTDFIRPICLPLAPNLRWNTFEGYTPFVVGWGDTAYMGQSSSILQEVQMDVINVTTCARVFSKFERTTIDHRVICAEAFGKDACRGDSGCPMMLPNGENFYLIGVVSYGYKCAEPGYPGVYTRVTEYIEWLARNMI